MIKTVGIKTLTATTPHLVDTMLLPGLKVLVDPVDEVGALLQAARHVWAPLLRRQQEAAWFQGFWPGPKREAKTLSSAPARSPLPLRLQQQEAVHRQPLGLGHAGGAAAARQRQHELAHRQPSEKILQLHSISCIERALGGNAYTPCATLAGLGRVRHKNFCAHLLA